MALILRTPEENAAFTRQIRLNISRAASPGVLTLKNAFQRRLRFPTPEELVEAFPTEFLPTISPVIPVGQVAPGTGTLLGCAGPRGGETISFSLTQIGIGDNIEQSDPIPWPFLVHHISISFEATAAEAAFWAGFISDDPSTDSDDKLNWRPILSTLGTAGVIENKDAADKLDLYPNFLVLERDQRIKNRVGSLTAVTVDLRATWEITPLA